MHFLSFRLCTFALACLLLAHCKAKKEPAIHIPANVNFAMVVDMKRVSSKAVEWKDIFSTQFLQNLTSEPSQNDLIGKILQSGLDYQKNIYLFGKEYLALSFSLKDSKAFEKILKKEYPDIDFKRNKTWEYAHLNAGTLIMWQKNTAFFVIAPTFDEKKILKTAQNIAETNPKKTLEKKNSAFQQILQQEADAIGWVNAQTLSTDLLKQIPNVKITLPTQLLCEEATFYTNFEQGEIKSVFKATFGDKALETCTKLLKPAIDTELIRNIPFEKPAILTGFSLNLTAIEDVLGNPALLSAFKSFLSFSGSSWNELLASYTGDVVLAWDKMELGTEPTEQDLVVCIGTKDAPKMLEFIEGFGMFLKIKKKEGYTVLKSDDYGKWYIVGKDKTLYLTPSLAVKDAILAGKTKLNPQSIALFEQKIGGTELNTLPAQTTEKLAKIFDKFQITVSPLQNKSIEAQSTLKLKDTQRNALPILIEVLK